MTAALACSALGYLGAAASPANAGGPRPAYRSDPPVAHTGGFGEPTCLACHFDRELNPDRGTLALPGLPERWEPGETYRITVRLEHSELEAGGFQLSARFADGDLAGRQAGSFAVVDDRATITPSPGVAGAAPIEYAHHTARGVRPTAVGVTTWTLDWTAPDASEDGPEDPGGGSPDDGLGEPVVIHAVGNAANDDASEFGDRIYATSRTLAPVIPAGLAAGCGPPPGRGSSASGPGAPCRGTSPGSAPAARKP